ncbi:hypothetical protein T06_773 [Trichinella sp. T6]|nr:hypothetical protein T06_773 [Trichinella sp. T6]
MQKKHFFSFRQADILFFFHYEVVTPAKLSALTHSIIAFKSLPKVIPCNSLCICFTMPWTRCTTMEPVESEKTQLEENPGTLQDLEI